jgi:hypothetical protein
MAWVIGPERPAGASRAATRAWLDILRGAWMVLPAAPAPSEVVAMVRESKGGQEEEEELAWLEALAGCLGAAVALARGQDEIGSQVGVTSDTMEGRTAANVLRAVEDRGACPFLHGVGDLRERGWPVISSTFSRRQSIPPNSPYWHHHV